MAGEVLFIVARATNGCIAKDGDVPWAISEDLRRFKRLTLNKPMIMGRKTFESLPGLLPKRRHIVLTRQTGWSAEGAEVAHSPEQALEMARNDDNACDLSVIGGAEIWRAMWDHGTHFELTEVFEDTDGDVFMPAPDAETGWREVGRESRPAADGFPAYDFVSFERLARRDSA